jgi:hypothetical protein
MKRYQDTDYYVTETGEVFSGKFDKLKKLKPSDNSRGYLQVYLMIDGKQINKSIHRLVGETFIPNPENYPQINHIDGNKLNNHVSNLEWCTGSDNIKHAIEIGLQKPNNGEENGRSKLTEQQVFEIRQLYSSGDYILKELGEKFGVSYSLIGKIINNKNWKHI